MTMGMTRPLPITDAGSRVPRDPKQALMSKIVGKMNDLFEGEELEPRPTLRPWPI